MGLCNGLSPNMQISLYPNSCLYLTPALGSSCPIPKEITNSDLNFV